MTTEHLLDMNALRARDQSGLQLEDGFYAWVILGPIEEAQYLEGMTKITEIGQRSRVTTVDDARELVKVMREQLALILPSMPFDVQQNLHDSEVDSIIRFFENKRQDDQVEQLEEAVGKAEMQTVSMERMKQTGQRMTVAAADVEEINKKIRRIGED